MRLILTKDVKKLGNTGEIIEVSDGFARNFLLPRHLGKPADEKAIAEATMRKKQNESKSQQQLVDAKRLMAKLGSTALEFSLPGDPEGHLYASLKESEILARITGGGKPPIKLEGYTPLKQAGTYEIPVIGPEHLTTNVKITIICQK